MGNEWHIMMVFEVPRGARLTMEVVEQLGDSHPKIRAVSSLPNGRLEFVWRAEGHLCLAPFTEAYQYLSDICADVLGYPADLVHGEVAKYEYWIHKLADDTGFQRWLEDLG